MDALGSNLDAGKPGWIGQALTAFGVASLAAVAIAWLATASDGATSSGGETGAAMPVQQSERATASSSVSPPGTLPYTLVLARDRAQALELRQLFDSESRLRQLLGEPGRPYDLLTGLDEAERAFLGGPAGVPLAVRLADFR